MKEILLSVLIVFGSIAFVLWLTTFEQNYINEQCSKQFGQGWYGKTEYYGADFCVNKKGEVKYPL